MAATVEGQKQSSGAVEEQPLDAQQDVAEGGQGDEGASAQETTQVKVHPLVVFCILDHFLRRQEGQERVIGTLLGHRDENSGVVEISNAFAVPHTEKEGEVAVGQATNKTMYGLLTRVNSKEKIVGWYATTNDLERPANESSTLIHDFYLQECASPVHLVVDTSMVDGVRLVALSGLTDSVVGLDVERAFTRLDCELIFNEAERGLLDAMICGAVDDRHFDTGDSLSVLPSQMDDVEDNVADLLDLIDDVAGYVDRVADGSKPVHPEAARNISDALATLPHLDAHNIDAAFNKNVKDIVMVSYLASLTKAQLAIAATINETF